MDDIALACRVLLAVVFAVSAVSKLAGRQAFSSFVGALRRMKLVDNRWSRGMAVLVVAAEIAIVVLLAVPLPLTGLAAFGIAFGLVVAFTGAIISVVARDIDTTCRCFGRTSAPLGRQHVVRNVFLLAVAALGLAAEATGAPAAPGALMVAAVAGLVLGGLVPMFDDLVDLFRTPAARRIESRRMK